MVTILDGKKLSIDIAKSLTAEIALLDAKPTLAIIQIGDRPDSSAYIRQKKIFAEKIGASVVHCKFPEAVAEKTVRKKIALYNADKNIHGIILQIPIPLHLDKNALLEEIDPLKDVDGLTARNVKNLFVGGDFGLVPATAKGIVSLLEHYGVKIDGACATVVGRSALVGRPVALALVNRGATVTVAHSRTKNLKSACLGADIIIVAIGKPEFITREYVSKNTVVVDVGINVLQKSVKKFVGDVLYNDAELVASAISPVPGGVGPMTVASLFQNLLQAYNLQKQKS